MPTAKLWYRLRTNSDYGSTMANTGSHHHDYHHHRWHRRTQIFDVAANIRLGSRTVPVAGVAATEANLGDDVQNAGIVEF